MGLWNKGVHRSQTNICRLQDVAKKMQVLIYTDYDISIDDERRLIDVYQGDVHVGYYICNVDKWNLFGNHNIMSISYNEPKHESLMYSPNFMAAVILTVKNHKINGTLE